MTKSVLSVLLSLDLDGRMIEIENKLTDESTYELWRGSKMTLNFDDKSATIIVDKCEIYAHWPTSINEHNTE